MGDGLNGAGGVITFQYLDGGFLLDIDDEPDLLRFWTDSDQEEGIPEVHLFMIHADPISQDVGVGVQPYVPRVVSEVDVAGPSTQSQREVPVTVDIDDYDDVVLPEHPHEQMSQQPLEHTSLQPYEQTSQQPLEHTSQQPHEQTSQQPHEQTSQQPHEQMSQQPHEQTSQPPDTPSRIFFGSKKVASKKHTPQKRAAMDDNSTAEPASKKKTLDGDELDELNDEGFDEEELDVLPECTNLDYHDIDDLPVEDDYHSSHSLSSDSEPDEESDCETDLDEEEE
ncbi:hypothetical protein MKW92_032559, partial [Papaver armeniacum]